MMRAPLIPFAAALALAAACIAGGSVAQEGAGHAPIVDVFPAQSWASLGAEPAPDAPPPPVAAPEPEPPSLDEPIDAPPVAAPPFDIAGEWRENDQRIVVLEGAGRTFLLCESRCGVRDAVLPGGEIAEGYRLKKLGEQGTVIVARGSTEVELLPPVPIR
ncbi:hypothetical protein WT67_28550 [Burkholderia stagnalis]|uniref:Uncharacterized protein n=2 Tax=Burkholderia stagnalis TaxID=1503054 RepID=A0A3N7Y2C3_9BURK|nr:hypothetical protein [Burkholderia stagnalis]KAB0637484.1 hypothetical protein F7R25_15730 [Burkholderia stagnalis]KVD94353.1 hypothetical protein WS63_04230 [Burkholderia stagnalis]KVN56454.1 hypothetical protein WT14_26680 [Burkholderia stagnalis]KVO35171.1 hypothetical protein WT17_27800 [Burkholderia stagnalis]KVO67127.1 hypothetical protein WT19_25525 [Burkholderia stagnalis]